MSLLGPARLELTWCAVCMAEFAMNYMDFLWIVPLVQFWRASWGVLHFLPIIISLGPWA